jgi:hypothetical protein
VRREIAGVGPKVQRDAQLRFDGVHRIGAHLTQVARDARDLRVQPVDFGGVVAAQRAALASQAVIFEP